MSAQQLQCELHFLGWTSEIRNVFLTGTKRKKYLKHNCPQSCRARGFTDRDKEDVTSEERRWKKNLSKKRNMVPKTHEGKQKQP